MYENIEAKEVTSRKDVSTEMSTMSTPEIETAQSQKSQQYQGHPRSMFTSVVHPSGAKGKVSVGQSSQGQGLRIAERRRRELFGEKQREPDERADIMRPLRFSLREIQLQHAATLRTSPTQGNSNWHGLKAFHPPQNSGTKSAQRN